MCFFDRDGVIINDVGYLSDINDIKFNEGIFNLMSYLKGKNYLLVSSQISQVLEEAILPKRNLYKFKISLIKNSYLTV